METENRIDEYLKRIEVNRPINGASKEYLDQLHIGHLTHIPFETFDLIDLKQLNISPDYVFNRLVRQNRGGVCYQMNGLFAFILENLGYNVQLIPCSVYNTNKQVYLDSHAHAALYVSFDNGGSFLCDVGFSRNFFTPLIFRTDCIQFAVNAFFRLTKTDDGLYYKLERGFRKDDDYFSLPSMLSLQTQVIDIDPERIKWITSYVFPIHFLEITTKLEDFQNTCSYILQSPNVILNHCTICRIHLCKPIIGDYSIVGKNYYEWIYENGHDIYQSFPISDDENKLKKLLKEKFNLTIERKIQLCNNSI